MNFTSKVNVGISSFAKSMRNDFNIGEREKKTTVVCKNCGAKTSMEMKYCGVCGASMKKV